VLPPSLRGWLSDWLPDDRRQNSLADSGRWMAPPATASIIRRSGELLFRSSGSGQRESREGELTVTSPTLSCHDKPVTEPAWRLCCHIPPETRVVPLQAQLPREGVAVQEVVGVDK
jgi:hypothetical protein